MSAFSTQQVNYFETRADGGFRWTVAYDVTFVNSVIDIDLRVKMTGDVASSTVVNAWLNGIETYWNQKVFFADSSRLYEVTLDFDFVNSGQHQTVAVHNFEGRANMLNWYSIPEGWGTGYLDEIAAHEVGHMLGNFDEYSGGGTFHNFVTTGTLMSDLGTSKNGPVSGLPSLEPDGSWVWRGLVRGISAFLPS